MSPRCSLLPLANLLLSSPGSQSQSPGVPRPPVIPSWHVWKQPGTSHISPGVTPPPKRAPCFSLSQLPHPAWGHQGARAGLAEDSPCPHAGDLPVPCDEAVCHPLPATGTFCGGPDSHPGPPRPRQHGGVPTRWGPQRFFTTRFYFSFLFDKKH